MRKNTNWTKIEGRIYQHNLEIKQVKNQESANFGKDFISGTIEVAVDDNLTNIIPIHYKTFIISLENFKDTEDTLLNINDASIKIIDIGETYAF